MMKKLLWILLVIQGFSVVYSFLALLGTNWFYAVIVLVLGLLSLVPIFAIITCLYRIDDLEGENYILKYKIKNLEDDVNGEKPLESETHPELDRLVDAQATWDCVKCGTVNKAGTTRCSNCKAEYSPIINPTHYPTKKKPKISRWVKYK